MVLCIAKPSASCACVFTALTVAVATSLVCVMAIFQAGLAAHGHLWALDWAVSSAPGTKSPGRTASSFDLALAAEREAMHWEMRNATSELRSLVLTRLDSLRNELVQSREQQHRELDSLRNELVKSRAEILESMVRHQHNMRRDSLKLRRELLNITSEQGREISDLLLEQLKALESIKLRGSARERETKKKSAIEEGLWGFLSSVREERVTTSTPMIAEEGEEDTTKVTTSAPSQAIKLLGSQREREKKKSAVGEGLWGLLSSMRKERVATSTSTVAEDVTEDTTKVSTSAPSEAITLRGSEKTKSGIAEEGEEYTIKVSTPAPLEAAKLLGSEQGWEKTKSATVEEGGEDTTKVSTSAPSEAITLLGYDQEGKKTKSAIAEEGEEDSTKGSTSAPSEASKLLGSEQEGEKTKLDIVDEGEEDTTKVSTSAPSEAVKLVGSEPEREKTKSAIVEEGDEDTTKVSTSAPAEANE